MKTVADLDQLLYEINRLIDQDTLQHMDECNMPWRRSWKKAVKKGDEQRGK